MDNGYYNLVELKTAADGNGQIPADTRYWLSEGIRRYADGEDLEKALHLHGAPGKRKASTLLMDENMDNYLLEAWGMVTDEPIKPRQRSELLHQKMSRFETSRYRAYQHYDLPPDNLPELQKILFSMFKTGVTLPGTSRGLHERIMRILEDHGGD